MQNNQPGWAAYQNCYPCFFRRPSSVVRLHLAAQQGAASQSLGERACAGSQTKEASRDFCRPPETAQGNLCGFPGSSLSLSRRGAGVCVCVLALPPRLQMGRGSREAVGCGFHVRVRPPSEPGLPLIAGDAQPWVGGICLHARLNVHLCRLPFFCLFNARA